MLMRVALGIRVLPRLQHELPGLVHREPGRVGLHGVVELELGLLGRPPVALEDACCAFV